MKIPVTLKVATLAVAATGFYTWVGQMVPQKEVQPPVVVELREGMTTQDMVQEGKKIFEGKGICSTCHKIGGPGPHRFPNLEGVAARAGSREPGVGALDYLAQSLYHPDAFIVPGFSPGMPQINQPPIGLTDQEILMVIAYLQTLGGSATVTPETKLPYASEE